MKGTDIRPFLKEKKSNQILGETKQEYKEKLILFTLKKIKSKSSL